MPGRLEEVALEREVGVVVVGEQDVGHERETSDGGNGDRVERYVAAAEWSSGLTAFGDPPARRRYNRRPDPRGTTVPRRLRSPP